MISGDYFNCFYSVVRPDEIFSLANYAGRLREYDEVGVSKVWVYELGGCQKGYIESPREWFLDS